MDGSARIESYRDLLVWQRGMTLAERCYACTRGYPKEELYGLTSQIRRCATSIPANIAEGYGRQSKGAYVQFLRVTQGSLKELETHLILSRRLGFLSDEEEKAMLAETDELGRMLGGLIRSIDRGAGS